MALLRIMGVDHVEMFVAELGQAARSLCDGFGFQAVGEGPHSLVLQQGSIRIVVTAAGHPADEVSSYVERHGDGIRDIALRVPDTAGAFREAVRLGARPIQAPARSEDAEGGLVRAIISSPVGDLVHSLIQRDAPESQFWPGRFRMREDVALPAAPTMTSVDHLALCVASGSLGPGAEFYQRVFGFHQAHEEIVQTEYSGMNSRVVQDAAGNACLVLMEPMPGKGQGQIGIFLERHRGPGVQHLAFRSGDIVGAVKQLRERRVSLLEPPPGYHERLRQRVTLEGLGESWQELREGCVLVDQEGNGYLLQAFTRSLHPRRTLFFEIIQRKTARVFGPANIRALYEAVEQELGHG